ncbi:MAG: WXG100 family type VII secretion target [Pseudorhodoplanes sp.]|nr:WXG100 family type VII secretion target [Pseudorhodoplanes sp.]
MASMKQDPDELRRFGHRLSGDAAQWITDTQALNSQMARLQQTWRDEQFDEFRRDMDQLMHSLQTHSDEVKKMVGALEEDATKLETYLKLNPRG